MLLESLRFAVAALWAHRLRAGLTGLGMVIGNASVILVVTAALTGRIFVLRLIEGVGSNLVWAIYEPGAAGGAGEQKSDYLTPEDVDAVRQQLGERAAAVAGVAKTFDRIVFAGEPREVAVLGADAYYRTVRNLKLLAGRFYDEQEIAARQKVCLLTDQLAQRIYGSPRNSLGGSVQVHGLPFAVIGVFKEGVPTFGQSEYSDESVLIPITVMRYFSPSPRVDPLYVKMRFTADVQPATGQIRQILASRHRPGSVYKVDNLAGILSAARQISLALTLVLLVVSAIALTISGIFIMNIMLITVTERTREIGVRMALGATRRQVQTQFLLEAGSISFLGGVAGIAVGLAAPLVARRFWPQIEIPVSPLSVLAALVVSCSVGVVFGALPASRAARLNPTEALRYE